MIGKSVRINLYTLKLIINFKKEECAIALQSKFTFIGELMIPKEDSQNPLLKRIMGGKDGKTEMLSLNFGVKANGSVGYVELFGMKTPTIFTMDADNTRMEVPWDERKDPEIVKSVANYRKRLVRIGESIEEFISDYEAAQYIAENIKELAKTEPGMKPAQVKVTGTIEKEPYVTNTGSTGFRDRYIIDNVTEVYDQKPCLDLEMTLFYNKDSFDPKEFKAEKTLTVDAYILQYLRNSKSVNKAIGGEAGKRFFMPQQVVLDASKVDMSDPQQKGIIEMCSGELKTPSNKKMYCCHWTCSLVNGAEEVPFDESQLTAKQKTQIELGLKTIDDFKPKGNIFGPREKKIKLRMPELKAEFEDGVIEADFSLSEFEEMLVKFATPESLDAAVEKATKDVTKEEIPFNLSDDDENEENDFDMFD